jgi:hypothetical protein
MQLPLAHVKKPAGQLGREPPFPLVWVQFWARKVVKVFELPI